MELEGAGWNMKFGTGTGVGVGNDEPMAEHGIWNYKGRIAIWN